MYNFKDGDLIKDSQGRVGTYDSAGPYCIITTSPQNHEVPGYKRYMSAHDWKLVEPDAQPEESKTKEDTTVSKFKVGDKVVCVDPVQGQLVQGVLYRVVRLSGLVWVRTKEGTVGGFLPERFELVQPKPAHESDWSYAEAERLQKMAHAAIDEYNTYINAKPDAVFLTIFK